MVSITEDVTLFVWLFSFLRFANQIISGVCVTQMTYTSPSPTSKYSYYDVILVHYDSCSEAVQSIAYSN